MPEESDKNDKNKVDISKEDAWVNPSTSNIIFSIIKETTDMVLLMKHGLKKVQTYALLHKIQRNKNVLYVKNKKKTGNKW